MFLKKMLCLFQSALRRNRLAKFYFLPLRIFVSALLSKILIDKLSKLANLKSFCYCLSSLLFGSFEVELLHQKNQGLGEAREVFCYCYFFGTLDSNFELGDQLFLLVK
jgi:hypothetical protein